MWLKGQDIVIKGKVVKDELRIDTIINSPFYYYAIDVLKKYSESNNKTQEEINNSLLTEIKNNIDNPFSCELASIFMNKNLSNSNNLKVLHGILSTQDINIKNHFISIYRDLEKLIAIESIQLDTFNFKDTNGHNSKISLNRDQIYMLDFWFTDCRPCLEDHKTIDSMYTFFQKSNVEVVGISTDYNETKWMNFVSKKKYKWNNYIEFMENDNTLSYHLGIVTYPTYLIIDSDGDILNRDLSLEKSVSFIKGLHQ
jgi:thiol-disulfide isomerase/thioredoxin